MPQAKTGRKVGRVDIAVSGQASSAPAALHASPNPARPVQAATIRPRRAQRTSSHPASGSTA